MAVTRTGSPDQTVGRYALEDLVSESAESTTWRATDTVLDRKVGVRLFPADDPRAPALREAACLAAQVTDPRLIRVLDVVEDDGRIAVVSEWVPGRPLAEFLDEPLAPLEAARVALEVSRALESAHAAGIAHGRIRPASLLVTEVGDVRVRGLGVDAVLWGVSPGDDPAAADVAGVGAILYAGLTGRWPDGDADGLTGVPRMAKGERPDAVPRPSRVAADIPAALDDIAARSVPGITPPKGRGRYPDVSATTAALSAAVADLRARGTGEDPVGDVILTPPQRRARWGRRWLGVGVGVVVVGVVGVLGWTLLQAAPAPVQPRSAGAPSVTSPSAAPTNPLTVLPSPLDEKSLPVVGVRDFDPLGNRQENPDLAGAATDGSLTTSWTTVRYRGEGLSGKGGVGLLLDLGAPRTINAVTLALVGRGTDVSLRVGDTPAESADAYRPFASALGAGDEIAMRSPKPATARYLLVWLTRLPALPDGGFQGGVSDIRVLG